MPVLLYVIVQALHSPLQQGIIMCNNSVKSITSKIFELQDKNECWNVLNKSDKRYPEFNHYIPKYKSTLWVLILLADIQYNLKNENLIKPLKIISNHFLDKKLNIYSLGKTHFPIPCLNGNMLYLHQYFHFDKNNIADSIIDFFAKYQRFDDGDFKTPSSFPYYSNRSCYGKHTCYWGIIKLLKGLSFIPKNKRSQNANKLINKCIDFILLHEVCFSSHNNSNYIHKNIRHLTFPNMYQGDYLEILWLLKREKIISTSINKALNLLKSKMKTNSTWEIERTIKDLIFPIRKNNCGNDFITKRARDVIDFYDK
jgi:hypothetical protein